MLLTTRPPKPGSHNTNKAIEFYQTSISLDPSYVLAYNNLGCALIMKDNVYKVIATLQDELKIVPDSPKVLNNDLQDLGLHLQFIVTAL